MDPMTKQLVGLAIMGALLFAARRLVASLSTTTQNLIAIPFLIGWVAYASIVGGWSGFFLSSCCYYTFQLMPRPAAQGPVLVVNPFVILSRKKNRLSLWWFDEFSLSQWKKKKSCTCGERASSGERGSRIPPSSALSCLRPRGTPYTRSVVWDKKWINFCLDQVWN